MVRCMQCAGCYKPTGGARGTCVDPKPAKLRGSKVLARIDPTLVLDPSSTGRSGAGRRTKRSPHVRREERHPLLASQTLRSKVRRNADAPPMPPSSPMDISSPGSTRPPARLFAASSPRSPAPPAKKRPANSEQREPIFGTPDRQPANGGSHFTRTPEKEKGGVE